MPAKNKYHRTVGFSGNQPSDVYDILLAYGVTCPARQHAIKKLLLAGERGKGNTTQDLAEAKQAIQRALELENPLLTINILPCRCGQHPFLHAADDRFLIKCDNRKCNRPKAIGRSMTSVSEIWNDLIQRTS